jgi:hypothetical protein
MNKNQSSWPRVDSYNKFSSWPAALEPGRIEKWPAKPNTNNEAQQLLSEAIAWWDASFYREGDRFLRNRGIGGELLDLRLGSSIAANTNDPLYLAPDLQSGYVYLPGVAGNYLSVPDENALDITGDIDIRVKVALDNWNPGSIVNLVAKWQGSGSRSYRLYIDASGYPRLGVTTDGVNEFGSQPSATTSLANGAAKWLRATLDLDDGAGNRVYRYYTSDDGSSWTQLGSTLTIAGTVASISSSVSIIELGSRSAGTVELNPAKFYRAQVLNGIDGTTVLDVDCDAITSGSATSFTATTGQTVTINRSTSGRKSVAMPSRWKGGRACFLLGTDDFLEVQDNWQHQLLNFGQGDSFTVLAISRQWGTIPANGRLMTKQDSAYARPGWELFYPTGTNKVRFDAWNGSANVIRATTAGTITLGSVTVATARIDRVMRQSFVSLNAGSETASSVFSNANLAGSGLMNIGRISGSGWAGGGNDMEFRAAAIFRRALTQQEISLLNTYFQNQGL